MEKMRFHSSVHVGNVKPS